eukprot:m.61858 g.61858  ORF g.61858 m.61858 type:complete len:463 (+) comp23047_c1_seq1:116-1504(+)
MSAVEPTVTKDEGPSPCTLCLFVQALSANDHKDNAHRPYQILCTMVQFLHIFTRELDEADKAVLAASQEQLPISSPELPPSPTDHERLRHAHRALRPGSKFEGKINVPGMDPEDFQKDETLTDEYTFMVLTRRSDPFGRPILYARHTAYLDTQFCDIQLSVKDDQVHIEYRDGETILSGTFDPDSIEINGTVRQLETSEDGMGDDGFEVVSDEIASTFDLKATSHSEALARKQYEVYLVETHILRYLQRTRGAFDLPYGSEESLKQIDWNRLFIAGVHYCEMQNSEIRQKTRLMQSMCFTTRADKRQKMAKLTHYGFTKAFAHQTADKGLTAVYVTLQGLEKAGIVMGESMRHLIPQTQERTSATYSRFESALNSLTARLSQEDIAIWRLSASDVAADPCAICMCDIELDSEVALKFPCKHLFHEECATSWIHNNSSCPNCRDALEELPNADVDVDVGSRAN